MLQSEAAFEAGIINTNAGWPTQLNCYTFCKTPEWDTKLKPSLMHSSLQRSHATLWAPSHSVTAGSQSEKTAKGGNVETVNI
jgi:hypothetical protein